MPDSLRKQILDALKSTLEGITTGNGYRRNILTVAYEAKDWAEIQSVRRDFIAIIPQIENFTDSSGFVQVLWDIDLVLHLTPSAGTSAAMMQACVDAASDIRKALYTPPANLEVDGVHFVRVVSRQGTEADPAALAMAVASNVVRIQVSFEEGITDS